MKIIKYNLNEDGTIPVQVKDGGYFVKYNGSTDPQDYDMIGFSDTWTGLKEFTTKSEFETYIKSFLSDTTNRFTNEPIYIQDLIDDFWSRK